MLGVAPGAPPAEVHRAAAAVIDTYHRRLSAGQLHPSAADSAYASVYAAVAGLLGLRMGLDRPVADLGIHSATVSDSFVLSESTTPTGAPSFRSGSPRMPYECEICGCFPAVPVTAVWVLSVLLVSKAHRETRALCRECGVNITSRAQAYTRTWGHFGIGALAAWISLLKNRRMLRALRRFTRPYARRPTVLTPETRPRSTGWFLRLWIFGAGLEWLVLLALLALSALLSALR